MDNNQTRREFLYRSIKFTGCMMVLPIMLSCESKTKPDLKFVPATKPSDWDPIAFNKIRGNAGAIPESYLNDINGPDGEKKHIGKHLPYIPDVDYRIVPKGYIPIMWGDPSKGHTAHPNAPPNASNNHQGHWYNWIRIRKATKWYATTSVSTYSNWPCIQPSDTGAYAPRRGDDITAYNGTNTIYLAKLPKDVSCGDTIRIWAHCLTHGEYVDFLTVPNLQMKLFV